MVRKALATVNETSDLPFRLPILQNPSPEMELSDDVLGVIFSSISDAKDRNSISLVCKQWLRVDGVTRTSVRLLAGNGLLKVILRFPNLTTFESSTPIGDLDAVCLAYYCPKIETLILNFDGDSACSDDDGIASLGFLAIAKMCPNLSVLLLQNRKSVDYLWIHALATYCCNLTCLDFSGCTKLTDQVIFNIGKMNSIQTLVLQGCSFITDTSLAILSTEPMSKNLKKLILSGCTQITELGVYYLSKIALEELSLADCDCELVEI